MDFSLGYHTFAIFLKLSYRDSKTLYQDFLKCDEIRAYRIRKVELPIDADEFTKYLYSTYPQYYVMDYPGKNKGITWVMRVSKTSPSYITNLALSDRRRSVEVDKPCSIRAIINPKVFCAEYGKKDYLTAASADDLEAVKSIFNEEVKNISPILGQFDQYSMNRGDYCANFSLQGLEQYFPPEKAGEIPMMIMELIKRSDVPLHYNKWTVEGVSDIDKIGKNSHYLKSGSAVVNIYCKQEQLQKKHPNCLDIENSRDLLRFEVQCKYPKMYRMAKDIKKDGELFNLVNTILAEDTCADVITKYFYRVVKPGDYYSLERASRLILERVTKWEKAVRLTGALKLIAQLGGIANAKITLKDNPIDLENFRRSLRDLKQLGINPVTIPDEWNIDYLPNLLDFYYTNMNNAAPLTKEEKHQLNEYNLAKSAEMLSDYEIGAMVKHTH